MLPRQAEGSGARPGFTWTAPRFLEPAVDVLGPLEEFFNERDGAMGHQAQFVVPDIVIKGRAGVSPDSEFDFKPMGYAKFVDLMRRLVQALGFQPERVTTYSLRRFVPSLADALKFPDSWAQAVGEWAEVPKGQDRRAHRAQRLMSKRYAADKSNTAGEIKLLAIVGVHIAAKREDTGLNFDSLRAADIDLRELEAAAAKPSWGQFGDKTEPTSIHRANSAEDTGTPDPEVRQTRVPTMPTREEYQEIKRRRMEACKASATPSVSSPSSSSSTSSSSGPDEDVAMEASGPEGDQTDVGNAHLEHVTWFFQDAHVEGKRFHLVHFVNEDGKEVPFCRKQPFKVLPSFGGSGLRKLESLGGVPCKACMKSAPEAVAAAIANWT